ncbi:MAG: phosphoserine transaminase [Alphaproteobacteria bacterium]|nr:phosphoserine transaminase [Alphaproteobacteria bacterium]
MTTTKPAARPARAHFSSGPCAKIPGWTPELLKTEVMGRSHRSSLGKARLKRAIELTREVLQVPATHLIGIVPASDTGAVEMAMWSLLGSRPVDMLAWESFGDGWVSDVMKQLKLKDARKITAGYGELPDLSTTSAAFAQRLDWQKLDVVTFSWQKVLGGEGAHGVLILGPRAVERLESYAPAWPLPKIFRLTSGAKLIAGIFEGETINTPSMLCVEDYILALKWAQKVGGLKGLMARADANAAVVQKWIDSHGFAANLAKVDATRSNTSVCLTLAAAEAVPKNMVKLLEAEKAAFDIGSYRDAPPGLRIWCGATVETSDLEALIPWLDWAYAQAT